MMGFRKQVLLSFCLVLQCAGALSTAQGADLQPIHAERKVGHRGRFIDTNSPDAQVESLTETWLATDTLPVTDRTFHNVPVTTTPAGDRESYNKDLLQAGHNRVRTWLALQNRWSVGVTSNFIARIDELRFALVWLAEQQPSGWIPKHCTIEVVTDDGDKRSDTQSSDATSGNYAFVKYEENAITSGLYRI